MMITILLYEGLSQDDLKTCLPNSCFYDKVFFQIHKLVVTIVLLVANVGFVVILNSHFFQFITIFLASLR